MWNLIGEKRITRQHEARPENQNYEIEEKVRYKHIRGSVVLVGLRVDALASTEKRTQKANRKGFESKRTENTGKPSQKPEADAEIE
jgi:hypothetical protein